MFLIIFLQIPPRMSDAEEIKGAEKKQEGNICFPEVWRYCNTIIVNISYIVYIVKYLFSRGISMSCEVVRSDGLLI